MMIMQALILLFIIVSLAKCDDDFVEIGPVYIKTHHDTYIRADPGLNARVYQSDSPGDYERFTVLKFDDGTYAFRTSHGTFLRAVDSGKVHTYDSLDLLGKFEMINHDDKRAFIAAHKRYLTAEKGSNALITADALFIDEPQRFNFEKINQ